MTQTASQSQLFPDWSRETLLVTAISNGKYSAIAPSNGIFAVEAHQIVKHSEMGIAINDQSLTHIRQDNDCFHHYYPVKKRTKISINIVGGLYGNASNWVLIKFYPYGR